MLTQLQSIISKHPGKRVLVSMGALGKHALLTKLAHAFCTLIVVPSAKLAQLEACGVSLDMYTDHPD